MSQFNSISAECISPRNDMVLIESVDVRSDGGVVLPDTSSESKRFVVVGMGPDVEDLGIGDYVEVMGKIGEDVAPLPSRYKGKLFITKQANILLRVIVIESDED